MVTPDGAGHWRWTPSGWRAVPPPAAGSAQVVDSWTVDGGRVRRLDRHLARFAAGSRAVVPEVPDDLLRGAATAVGDLAWPAGSWFPRVEVHRDPVRILLWLRPAPPRRTTARLWVPPDPDPRREPTRKGPDLPVLARLRERARDEGYDDALLLAPEGTVREAAHSALLWWRDGELREPPPDGRLPSVTASVLLDVARAACLPTGVERVGPEDLAGAEVWAVNALHGARTVERIGPHACAPPGRAEWMRAALGRQQGQPVAGV